MEEAIDSSSMRAHSSHSVEGDTERNRLYRNETGTKMGELIPELGVFELEFTAMSAKAVNRLLKESGVDSERARQIKFRRRQLKNR